jgi:hypothetical protein
MVRRGAYLSELISTESGWTRTARPRHSERLLPSIPRGSARARLSAGTPTTVNTTVCAYVASKLTSQCPVPRMLKYGRVY